MPNPDMESPPAALSYDFAEYLSIDESTRRFAVRFHSPATTTNDQLQPFMTLTLVSRECKYVPANFVQSQILNDSSIAAMRSILNSAVPFPSTSSGDARKQVVHWIDLCKDTYTCCR